MSGIRGLIIIIAVVLTAAAGYVFSQWSSYHKFEGKCLDCHISIPKPGDNPRAFLKDITFMCVECHEAEQELSHPVDIRPSMAVADKFPLDWKGQITCTTCHPVHQPGYGDFRLRVKASGQAFCVMCHDDLDSAMHQISLGTAHVSKTTSSKFIPWELGAVLDELSIRCLSCHDAAFGGDALVENLEERALFHNPNDIGLSHPIGVSYVNAKRKYQGAYRKVSDLPPQIKLFGGQVGCGSCHNPYSKRHFELVMSNERSALCLACHVK